jgi:HD superfamily phosphodiesterase
MASDLARLKAWFSGYAKSFTTGEPELDRVFKMKETHTARVCLVLRRLGRRMNLPPRDLELGEIMALLHDVGRFRQYARYRTFRDQDSENHATLGVRVINRHGLLSELNPLEKRHVTRAIAHHNSARVQPIEDAQSLFFLKLLRDADKLDIWRVMIGHLCGRAGRRHIVNEFGFADGNGCTPQALAELRRRRVVPLDAIRTQGDVILFYISWVFDLNFDASYSEVRKGCYIERLAAPLPDTQDIREVVAIAGKRVADRTADPAV